MSVTKMTLGEFRKMDVRNGLGMYGTIAIIGSRSACPPEARNAARVLSRECNCTIVSGGAVGADQAGIEGAMGAPACSLDGIVPVSSRNIGKLVKWMAMFLEIAPEVDRASRAIVSERLIVFYPDFSGGYHPSRYHERDRRIIGASKIILAFWDGISRGTKKTIDYAVKEGKPVIIVSV